FVLAGKHESAANAAFDRHDAATAEQRYREAATTYGLAKSMVERGRAAAAAAMNLAAEAKKKAELANAPQRAAALWAKAEAAYRDAGAALDRHVFDGATTLFGEAEKSYREAEQTAAVVPDNRDREDAERAKTLVATARHTAERADARRLAAKQFSAAQQKE